MAVTIEILKNSYHASIVKNRPNTTAGTVKITPPTEITQAMIDDMREGLSFTLVSWLADSITYHIRLKDYGDHPSFERLVSEVERCMNKHLEQ